MTYLIGFNIIAFAMTLLIVMISDMEMKDKAKMLVLLPVFVGAISIGAFFMTEG